MTSPGEEHLIVSHVTDRRIAIENQIERGRTMVANGHAEIAEAMVALHQENLHIEAGYPNIYAYALDKWGFDANRVDRYLATARMIKRDPAGRAARGPARVELTPAAARMQEQIVERRSARIPLPVSAERLSTATVYLIGNDANNLIKIGISTDVVRRLGELRIGSPVRLDLLATFPGYGTEERWLHGHPTIAPHHSHGEWFALGSEAVRTVRELLQEN